MGCYNDSGSPSSYEDIIKWFLCRACKQLTTEQLKAIEWNDKSDYGVHGLFLFDWHVKHCEDDARIKP